MARKLYRFTLDAGGSGLLLGAWLWLGYGFKGGWLHAKLALVVLVIGYHHACGSLLKKFEQRREYSAATSGSACSMKCRFSC
jgi:putative membrane protein